ncbi:MAG: hypothetical protein BGO09_08830 [Bacteroidetes bacterium 47-18]|nr:MAG: hypothetical protein BGO09_08830 [Bacteroidetes bacterium 47-18]
MDNYSLDFIIGAMNAWQYKKEDKAFVSALLANSHSFTITVPQVTDTEFYHLYIGLDLNAFLRTGTDSGPKLYVFVLPASADSPAYIRDNCNSYTDFITTSLVCPKVLTDTEIDSDEALRRINNWSYITEWVTYNQVFNAFKIPAADLEQDPTESVTFTGFFGIKEVAGLKMPDIVIAKTTAAGTETFYDMARLCPPFKSQDDKTSLGLLEFVYVAKAF